MSKRSFPYTSLESIAAEHARRCTLDVLDELARRIAERHFNRPDGAPSANPDMRAVLDDIIEAREAVRKWGRP